MTPTPPDKRKEPRFSKIKQLPAEIIFGTPFALGLMALLTSSMSDIISAIFLGLTMLSFLFFALIFS